MRTIAVLNQKGGVGKTTTTVNTAAAIAAAGCKVVVIDFDPQAHMTIHLGVEPQDVKTGAYEVLTESAGFESSLMLIRPNLWLLPANINLVGAETELVNVVGREIILREAMQGCADKFDFCLIDCAPSLGLLSLNALAAAEEVLIPLQPHFLALQGFGKLLQTVDLVNKRINPRLKVTGVLLCMHDTRASLSSEVRSDIEGFLENARGSNTAWSDAVVLPSFIRRNIKLAEAPSYGQTIFEYDPTCNGAEDYRKVGDFFMGIGDGPEESPESEAQPEEPSQPECLSDVRPEMQPEEPTVAQEPPCDAIPAGDPEPATNEAEPELQVQELHTELESASEHTDAMQEERPEPPAIEIREFQLPSSQKCLPQPLSDGCSSSFLLPEPPPARNELS